MSPTMAQIILALIIVLCGYIVAFGSDTQRPFAFAMGVISMGLSIYLRYKTMKKDQP